MAKRLKELIVDNEGCLRERSGQGVDVSPVGFPVGLAIPDNFFYDKENSDKRKVATFLKNFLRLYQPQCVNLPGIPSREYVDSNDISKTIDYYVVNLEGQVMGTGDFNRNLNARRVTAFDTQGREVTQYEEQETPHHLGAIQFYRKR